MKLFLCIGYFDPTRMAALPAARLDALMADCAALLAALYATERVLLDIGVDAHAITLGADDVADAGAQTYAPARHLGSTFLIEASDLDDARRIAALHPAVSLAAGRELGWQLDVRPVHSFKLLREEFA